MDSKGENRYFIFFGKGTFFLNYVLLTYDSHSIKYPTMQIPVGLSVLRGSHDPHHHCAYYSFITKRKHTALSGHPWCLLPSSCGQPCRLSSVISLSLASLHAQSVKACGTYLLKGSLQGRTLAPAFVCFNYKKQKQRKMALLRYP